MSEEILRRHQAVWNQKPILRRLYASWYREIATWLHPGVTLEVGGGTGTLKEFSPSVVCTDVVRMPCLDALADAQHLPFHDRTLSNIVLFDVLHHLENVRYFFDEALRVLSPSGRIIIMDPYVSVASWPVYRFFHSEPLDFSHDPLSIITPVADRRPFDANQAIARIVFERSSDRFHQLYPHFSKLAHERLAYFAYPLSGGFDRPSLLPLWSIDAVLRLERWCRRLGRLFAFRLLVVLEKTSAV
ncbi:MAG TPA: class I SAM-dependent methyltransferase [Nitrospiraceae bacterium]|nr:class I SAM-dependent methyltransferase [Nitrospiraceae bacterium]